MRKKNTNTKGISVNAIAGTYVVLLGMNATNQARKGLLGFSIERTDKTENEKYWLLGFKTFEEINPNPTPGSLISTFDNPVQGFLWGDYTAKPNHEYIYKVVPVYGTPKNLQHGNPVEVKVTTEDEDNGTHAIYFNRGVAGSQAFVRAFPAITPALLRTNEKGLKKLTSKDRDMVINAKKWLSRGAEEAILAYIAKAKGKNYSIRAAVYEFSHEKVLKAFKTAADSGADVKIIYDCRKAEPQKTSNASIKAAGIRKLMIPRKANKSYISHNKYIVLLYKGKPVEVLTGSTNFTDGGIYGQSNVVHIVRDPKIAAIYLDYWERLSKDPVVTALKPLNVAAGPDPAGKLKKGIYTIFSPRTSLAALEWYADQVDAAKTSIGFTAAFGVNKSIANNLAKNLKNFRYVLLEKPGNTFKVFSKNRQNFVALGAVLDAVTVKEDMLHQWLGEELSGLNSFVKYLHTKYLFVDPLSDDPTVISGSANFSDASTVNNDENMLLVQGNTMVADIYLGEFMRIWDHFYFRDVASRIAKMNAAKKNKKPVKIKAPYLSPDDSWTNDYYGKSFRKTAVRQLFS